MSRGAASHAKIRVGEEANQHFSRILREVEAGAEIVVTRRGPTGGADRAGAAVRRAAAHARAGAAQPGNMASPMKRQGISERARCRRRCRPRLYDQHTFSLGGKDFELTYLGEGHSDDLIAMVVRPENVAFVVDVVSPKSVPWRDFPNTDINGMIEQIKTVEALDFEIMAPGHSVIGTKLRTRPMCASISKRCATL